MRQKFGMLLAATAGWLLMMAMVLAPWLRGSVSPLYIAIILWILVATALCWVVSLVLLHGMPTITPVSIVAGILLLQGWIMAGNPISKYDPLAHLFIQQENFPLLPGSVDGYSSILCMISFTILVAIFHVAIDCWNSPSFRNQFLWTVSATGASVALLGLLQKTGIARFVPLDVQAQNTSEFGPFGYHANAAALMLATLPISLSLSVSAWTSGTKRIALVGSFLSLAILTGIFANTARAGVALAVPLTAFLAIAYWKIIGGVLPGTARGRWLTVLGVLTAAGLGVFISAIVMPDKWHLLIEQMSVYNPRLLQWKIAMKMAGDAGFFGMGPNTFALTFPVTPHFDPQLYPRYLLTYHMPGEELSIWSHAHSDPIQALVEFGWIGIILWLILPVWTAVMAWRQINEPGPVHLKLTLLGPLVGWMSLMAYSTFDFPLQVLSLQLYTVVFAGIIWSGRATEIQNLDPTYAFDMRQYQQLNS